MDDTPAITVDEALSTSEAMDTRLRIGHVHLRVSDPERSLTFYHDVLGFELTGPLESGAAFLAGGYRHHIALNTWQSLGGPHPAPDTTGLHHLAILYPDRSTMAVAYRRAIRCSVVITGAFGVSERSTSTIQMANASS